MRETIKTVTDLTQRENKQRLMSQVGMLTGVWEVEFKPRRNTRSLQQQRWYFGAIVNALYDVMRAQDYEVTTAEHAHEYLKDRFLRVPMVSPMTGEVIGSRTGSTSRLTTAEMADYCENCRHFLSDFFGIIVPDPDPAWRTADSPSRSLTAV